MAGFWIIDLTATGEIRLKQEYEYRFLEEIPGAIDLIALFSTHLWRSPDEFTASLPGGHLVMRWRSVSETSGIATLWYRKTLASLSILLTGAESHGGADTLVPVQNQLVRELRQHHRAIASHVVRTVVVNEQHLTDDQLLAKAREVYAELAVVGSGVESAQLHEAAD